MLAETEIQSCCAVSYGHPMAGWLLGDSWHPGGLKLTSRLAESAGVGPNSQVLDIGSGLGTSAVHLAVTTRSTVTGVTLEEKGVTAGCALAQRQGVSDRVTFVLGDILQAPLGNTQFDVAVAECVLSILPDKARALQHVKGLLAPGGRIAMTDVTVSGELPSELQSLLAVAGCVGGALPLSGYRALIEEEGFIVEQCEDLPETAGNFTRDIMGKLMMAELAVKLGKVAADMNIVDQAKSIRATIRDLVQRGVLSYGLLVARVP
ncbi:MAG: methyltransferase domain-containing protein [Chloroflexi bacterium]|nr:methyltransferase domain-containing protein [Chloroflexota bacterium]